MKILIILSSLSLISCHTVQDIPDPTVNWPTIPGELMKPPVRPQPIGNNVQISKPQTR
jgi:hypothetical protein